MSRHALGGVDANTAAGMLTGLTYATGGWVDNPEPSVDHLPADCLTTRQLISRINRLPRPSTTWEPCAEHDWIDVTKVSDPHPIETCARCGETEEDHAHR